MKKKKRPFLAVLAPALLIAAALIAGYALLLRSDWGDSPHRPGTGRPPVHEREAARDGTSAAHRQTQPQKGIKTATRGPRVALIIDDLGYHRDVDLQLIGLDIPLSVAILPSAPFTDVVAQAAARQGRDILLHQPMEPKDYPCVEPGPGALLLSMDEKQLTDILRRNLGQIPGVRGMNNHMGSSFTENREKMSVVLRELRRQGLFYIDSRTTNGTVGLEEAKKIGLPAAQRTIFLDNNPDPEAIYTQIGYLLRVATRSGFAIGIGHPYPQTLGILRQYQHGLGNDVAIVPVSDLVK
jgi:uncharacterized protein